MAYGAGVGAGTMAFKNYGDLDKSNEEKFKEIGLSAGIAGVVNGVIAALTKGKVKNIIPENADNETRNKILNTLANEPEKFGLDKAQADAVIGNVNKHIMDNGGDPKKFWKEIINPNKQFTNYKPDWRYAVEEGKYPIPVNTEPETVSRPKPAETLFTTGGSHLAQSMGVGAVTGTSNTYNALDEYQQGKIDEVELERRFIEGFLVGTLGGYAGIKALKALRHISPETYENIRKFVLENYNPDGSAKAGAFDSNFDKLFKKEKKNIFKVYVGEKDSTIIRKWDKNIVSDIINFTQGNRKYGAKHILQRHFGENKTGSLSKDELLNISDVVNNGDIELKDDGKRVYTLYKNGIRYRVITGENSNGEIVISYYSNRKPPAGSHNAHQQAGDLLEGIITYKPQTNFKEWIRKIENDNDIQIGMFVGGAPKSKSKDNDSGVKIVAPHLKKIVYERLNKEWDNVDKSLKGWFNLLFTNTFSADYLNVRDKLYQAKNQAMHSAEDLHKTLNELPIEDRIELHEYLVGDKKDVSEELKRVGTNIRKTIDELTQNIVDEGILSEEAVKEWKDVYLKRIYEKHFLKKIGFDKKTLEKINERGNKIELKNSDIDTLNEFLAPLGLQASGYRNVEEFLKNNQELLQKRLKDGGIRAKKLPNGKYELKRDWTYEERTKIGEIRDAAITVPNTIISLNNLVEHSRFLKEIANVDGAVLSEAMAKQFDEHELMQRGFVKLPKSPRYGALSGLWIRRDVKEDLDELGKSIFDMYFGTDNPFVKKWLGYLRLWKKGKTVYNSTAHINNTISNWYLMHLGGMSAEEISKHLAKSIKVMRDAKRYKEITRKAMVGAANQNELAELKRYEKELKYYLEAENLGLLNQSQLHDILRGEEKVLDNPSSVIGKVDNFLTKAYQAEDEINKLSMYMFLRERGWSKDEAKGGVEAVMPDYTKPLPRAYRFLRDTGISPFISWTYYTFPKIFKLIKTKEGAWQATKALGTLYLLSYYFTGFSPLEDIPFVDTDKPEWTKGRYIPLLKDGNEVTMLKYDRWIPYLQLIDLGNFARDIFGGIPVNFASATFGGVKPYNRRPITYENKSFGDKVYDYAKYYIQSFVPLPQQLYSGYDIIESIARDKRRRKTDSVIEPRSNIQNIFKFLGVNTLTYNKSVLKREQKREKSR